jgi:APA family basic amino acid/polyamine antiporter
MQPLLNIGMRAARRAGDLIVKSLSRLDSLKIDSKGRNDFVTDIDRKAEADIIATIRRSHPQHAFLAEEGGRSGDDEFVWIIDPLDGTTNFLHGFPTFAVSIALEHKGRLQHAVVYDPMRQEFFTASRGDGAQLEGRKIRVSTQRTLEGSLIGTGFPFRSGEHVDAYLAMLKVIMGTAAGVRRPGAAALDLAYVAAGRIDGFWEFGLSPWDTAAASARPQASSTRLGPTSSRATPRFTRNCSTRWRRLRRRLCARRARANQAYSGSNHSRSEGERMSLFRTKPIDVNADTGLKRCLGAFDLTMLGIGCIIGTGIFVLTGVVAAQHSGPAIVLSFILSGTACAFAALCYAELAGAIGGAGSAYGYAYSGIGELIAWIIGWDLILEYAIATSTVAIGWSGYFGKILELLGVHLPHALTNAPLEGGIANVPAMVIVLLLSVLLSIGVSESAKFNTVMVFVKLAAVTIFIIVAAPHVDPANWHPFVPPQVIDADGQSHFGYGGVLTGASLIFFAYIGFDAVSTAAEETIKPQRNLPIGIIASLVICTILYILVSGILTGVVHYDHIDVKAPIADALKQLGIGWAEALISIGALAGITTVMLVLYFGLTRVVLAMSRDGLLPTPMAKVNPKTQTPVRLILGSGVAIALIAGLSPIGKVAQLVNLGTLAAFFMVCASVIVLRKTRPELKRPFRTPLVPLVPILGMGFCAFLMAGLPAITWEAFFIWSAIGLAIFFLYSRTHSIIAEPLRAGR